MTGPRFGTVKKEDQFRVLLSYSPLHNIKKGVKYPSVLVNAADLDDRVLPWHQYKYVAALQNSDLGPAPKLLHLSYGTGHVFGKSQSTVLNERTNVLTFLANSFGMKLPKSTKGGP